MTAPAIFNILTNAAGVVAIVSDRVYPELTDGQVFPLILYEVDEDFDDGRTYDGPGIGTGNASIHCVANDFATADGLGDAVIAALDGKRGTFAGVEVQGTFHDADGSTETTREMDIETVRFVRTVGFILKFRGN